VIRRLMTELEKAKLVKSVAGRAGGFELNRDAAAITLADVYFAVEDETVFRMHKTDPSSQCPVAAQLGQVLSVPLRAAECALHSSLAKTSIRDVAISIV
jgi:Rrf2 family protein